MSDSVACRRAAASAASAWKLARYSATPGCTASPARGAGRFAIAHMAPLCFSHALLITWHGRIVLKTIASRCLADKCAHVRQRKQSVAEYSHTSFSLVSACC